MGWLVGLPLGIFRLLGGLLMLALRFALPVLIGIGLLAVLRRLRGGAPQREKKEKPPKEPEFTGPVYTVHYQDVAEEPQVDDAPDGPLPFGSRAAWLAVQCDGSEPLLRALGGVRCPANWSAGLETAMSGQGVFVSPPLNGWVLAVGLWDRLELAGRPETDGPRDRWLADLARQFPQVQLFATHQGTALHRWGKFVDGAAVRDYCCAQGRVLRDAGDWTMEEIALGFGRFPRLGQGSWEDLPTEENVLDIAAAWGVDTRFEAGTCPPSAGWLVS